jgi:DNA-binding transcriptional ArsR family regulator
VSISEVAKVVGKPFSTTSLQLHTLESKGLVTSTKKGKQRLFSLKKNPLVHKVDFKGAWLEIHRKIAYDLPDNSEVLWMHFFADESVEYFDLQSYFLAVYNISKKEKGLRIKYITKQSVLEKILHAHIGLVRKTRSSRKVMIGYTDLSFDHSYFDVLVFGGYVYVVDFRTREVLEIKSRPTHQLMLLFAKLITTKEFPIQELL